MTNQEQLNKYLDYLTARGQSKNYFNIIRIWLSYMEEQKIEIVSQDVITNFFITNSKYSLKSRNQFILAGRSYYSGFLQIPKEQNEWYKIKLIKTEQKIPEYLTEKDIEEAKKYLITYFSNKMTPTKIRAVIDFMYYSGCRKNELLTIKRSSFNLEENSAKLYGKGDKERIICYPEKVKKEIQDYFISENEEGINAFNLTLGKVHYIMKLLKKYLGKNIYSHLIRHSFARNLIYNKGVDINTVSKLLGHASLTTTMIYINPDEKTIKENYKKLVG
jgi:site-specific recombinase XerD